MKTLVVVALLIAVAVATGGSFVVRGDAQDAGEAPSGTLELVDECHDGPVPRLVDTLIVCRFRATNTGDAPIAGATITFSAAQSWPIPDSYGFFDARVIGPGGPTELEVTENDLSYELGDIPSGGSVLAEISVVVRAGRKYGAVAHLQDAAYTELDSLELVSDVTDQPDPGLRASIVLEPPDVTESREPGYDRRSVRYALNVQNAGDQPAVARIRLLYGPAAQPLGRIPGWLGVPRSFLLAENVRIDSGATYTVRLPFQPSAAALREEGGTCGYVRPIMVVTAQTPAGEDLPTAAALPDTLSVFENCPGASIAGLPAGGTGPTPQPLRPTTLALLASCVGVLLAAAGDHLRARRKVLAGG